MNNKLMKVIVMKPVDYVAVKCVFFRTRAKTAFTFIALNAWDSVVVPSSNFCYIIELEVANSKLSASRIVERRK